MQKPHASTTYETTGRAIIIVADVMIGGYKIIVVREKELVSTHLCYTPYSIFLVAALLSVLARVGERLSLCGQVFVIGYSFDWGLGIGDCGLD
jgi:hypothetical protein